ncbi:hypothetical protein [Amniculibacterium sp. G2-70]|uniref:hypothetical protein n=1 Tax=Amniculibacterium sp. G2-70 TaxID=2767188 RepID=UPI00165489E5|nr:hypothetical protein [Amniculibacterium sp. G2-70]
MRIKVILLMMSGVMNFLFFCMHFVSESMKSITVIKIIGRVMISAIALRKVL